MPYLNVPEALWGKLDSCVKQVMAQGHDKPGAIAICYASIVDRKALGVRVVTLSSGGKQGGWVTIDDKPVFIGGPGQGGGAASAGGAAVAGPVKLKPRKGEVPVVLPTQRSLGWQEMQDYLRKLESITVFPVVDVELFENARELGERADRVFAKARDLGVDVDRRGFRSAGRSREAQAYAPLARATVRDLQDSARVLDAAIRGVRGLALRSGREAEAARALHVLELARAQVAPDSGKKEGHFVTLDDNRIVFIGGPREGRGSGEGPGIEMKWQRTNKIDQDDFKEGSGDTSYTVVDRVAAQFAQRWDVSNSDLAELVKEEQLNVEIVGDGAAAREAVANYFLSEWGSGGGGAFARAAIARVADDLGLPYQHWYHYAETTDYIRARPAFDRATNSFGRTMYAWTQEWLAEKGVEGLWLLRSGGTAETHVGSSWSLNWGGVRHDNRELVQQYIPKKFIFSTPVTGFGTMHESEIVVLPRPAYEKALKQGHFVTIDDRVVFIGGPGQGGGGAGPAGASAVDAMVAVSDARFKDVERYLDKPGGSSMRSFMDDNSEMNYNSGWSGSLSQDEIGAFREYTGYNAAPMNALLRDDPSYDWEPNTKPKTGLYAEAARYYQKRGMSQEEFNANRVALTKTLLLDRSRSASGALGRASLPQDVVVFRAMEREFIKDLTPGVIWQDPGFVSTTRAAGIARYFNFARGRGDQGVVVEMRIPKGARAAWMQGLSTRNEELELLIQPGSHFVVLRNGEMPVLQLLEGDAGAKSLAQKEGHFVTLDDGHVIFIGGPGEGGGGVSNAYPYARNRDEWITLAEAGAPAPDALYRWANLQEIHDMFLHKRTRSMDVSEDPEFYFAPPKVLEDSSFVGHTYGRFVLDGPALEAAGWKRDPGLFGEMAWRRFGKGAGDTPDQVVIDAYRSAIRRYEIISNPGKIDLDSLQGWLDYRMDRHVPVVKGPHYSDENFLGIEIKAAPPAPEVKASPQAKAIAKAAKREKKGVTPELIQTDFIDAWNRAVMGTPESDRLQKVGARTFGFNDPAGTEELQINWQLLYPMGEMYNLTQKALERRGYQREQTVPAYHPYVPQDATPKQWKKGQMVRIKLLPLTSWTTDIQEAARFASYLSSASTPGLVLKSFIPVSSIISTPETGIGTAGTNEIVLAGGEYESLVEMRYA